ncbi:MAG: fluoride efflux transporter CrcB [Actinomycetales bacterium]
MADEPRAKPVSHGSIDPDVDLHDAEQRDELHHHHPKILGSIALGGVIGAEARYGLALAIPHAARSFPWATTATNLSGCLLIGALMAVLAGRARRPRLARPFLGVGILGGFTTFSTYALDLRELLGHHHPATAAAYLLVTLAGGVLAVVLGLRVTETLLPARSDAQAPA